MSTFTRAPFAEVAPHLEATGYQPVPIKPGHKAPMLDNWLAGHPVEHWLPHRHPSGRVTDCSRWGTGVLAATCPAIDIDIRDRACDRALVELADDMVGGAPFRVGNAPKVLLPFSTPEPFAKTVTRWFALPGEDWRAPGYEAHRVEILGERQQFVAYAVHPGTGRPYRWGRGEPMCAHLVDLPEITEELAAEYAVAAEEILVDVMVAPPSGGRPAEMCVRRRSEFSFAFLRARLRKNKASGSAAFSPKIGLFRFFALEWTPKVRHG